MDACTRLSWPEAARRLAARDDVRIVNRWIAESEIPSLFEEAHAVVGPLAAGDGQRARRAFTTVAEAGSRIVATPPLDW